jgi:hypothetical protein
MSYRYKRGKYVEDTTMGKSKVIPKKYKGDMMLQAWVDSRKVAAVSAWLDQDGPNTRHMSDVLKLMLDAVVKSIKYEGFEMKSFDESRAMLESKYKVDLNPQGRGLKNLRHNMVLESLKEEEYSPVYNTGNTQKTYWEPGMAMTDEEGYLKAEEEFRKQEEERHKAFVESEKKRAIEAARASGILYEPEKEANTENAEDDEATIVREGMSVEEANARQAKKDREQEEAMKNMMSFRPNVVKTDKP